jgi:hypothetical protein
MREIKFRAKVNGTYVYSKSYINIAFYFDATKDYEQEQFTGLLDKNDKEIYEGDILKTKYGSKIHFKDLVDYHLWAYRNSMAFDEIEIIGNIYENPELLNP